MPTDKTPEIRDAMEVQRAHDTLMNIVTHQIDIGPLSSADQMALKVALDVLCWALKHDHNPQFDSSLKQLRDLIAKAGYTECKADAPFTLEDLLRRPS